ncbi:MAG: WD40/YVTN/BNR-like repeat-containing protein, partial [Anaerolineae bacterium]
MSQLFRLSKVLAVALMLLAAVRVTLGAAQPPGVGWERVFGLPVAARLFDVEMVSDSLGWAVGDEGVILRYNGAGWQAVPSPTPFRLYGMALTTPTDGWAVGDYGTVLRLSGGQWSVWPQRIPDANLFAVAMPRPDLGWAVGRAGTILTFDGSRWEQ